MRIGLYGGTFDPVHYGHLLLAESCREACRLDQVWFIPAQVSPHKLDVPISPARARIDMLEFALAGMPEFVVSRMEVDRAGPSFTVDTLRQIRFDRPDDELFLLLGADSIADFPRWREPQQIVELATLVAVNRAGDTPDLTRIRALAGSDRPVLEVAMPGVDFSGTEIRRRAGLGLSLRFRVPRPVEHYIRDKRLYRPRSP